jgi:RimJ/RimL family protein N-acetyltransferase
MALRPPSGPLVDGVVMLRAWRTDDLDGLVEICQDPEIQRFTAVPEGYSRDDALMFMAVKVAREERGEAVSFAVDDAVSSRLVGSVDLRCVQDGCATIGYMVGAGARRRGVATRALRLVSRWALAELGLARLEVRTRVDNAASQRVAERAGFTREGVLRSYIEHRGERLDAVMFSLIADDLACRR